jgi:large-conductance mechanosensitive channel
MSILKKYYLLIVLVLVGTGLGLEYIRILLDARTRNPNLEQSAQDISNFQPLFSVASSFLTTLAIAIFVSIFILKKMEDIDKAKEKAQADADKIKEKAQLEAIRKELNENVFDSLFRTLIPKEIYEVIKDTIIKCPIVRRNAVWIYDFMPLAAGGFELKQTLKSELHNISRDVYKDGYEISFKTSGGALATRLVRFICERDGVAISHTPSGDNLEKTGKEVVPLEISPGKHADITFIFMTKYNGSEFSDTYYSSHAIINATLIANYPAGYRIDLFDNFSSEMRESSSDDVRKIYELNGAILPGQGLTWYLCKLSS